MPKSIADIPTSIQLATDDGGVEELTVETRMREIPDRRFSGRGIWRGRPVFYKIFIATDRVGRHAARERSGAAALAQRGIDSAALVHEAPAQGEGLPAKARALLYDWIEGAENLDHLLKSRPSETRALALLRDLARLIGRHHSGGIVQKDLHFANFALAGDRIYTFDAASIEMKRPPISKGLALDNLAVFFAQMDPGWDSAVPLVLDAYAETAGAELRPDLDRLWPRMHKERRRRMDRFLDKMLRSCRLTEVVTTSAGKVLIARREDSQEIRELAESLTHPRDGLSLEFHDHRIRLRAYDPKTADSRDGGPARRAWRHAQRLVLEGVSTPAPLAAGGGKSGWFLADQPVGATLESLVAEGDPELERIADEVAHILQRLDQLSIEHGNIGRRSFVRLHDGSMAITEVENITDRPTRPFGSSTRTSQDMLEAIECWKSGPMRDLMIAALQRRGYALDLL